MATVGDEQPVAAADRPEVRSALEEPDPHVAIAQAVAYVTALLDRTGDLIMVSVEAAGADPNMQAAAQAGAKETHRVSLVLTRALQQRGALRDDLDATTTADIMYARGSPHVHQLLRHHRGGACLGIATGSGTFSFESFNVNRGCPLNRS